MDKDEHELEDGEIEDDVHEDEVVNTYTLLERPNTYALDTPQRRFPEAGPRQSDSEDDLQSSESESDSDSGLMGNKKPKKQKLRKRPLVAVRRNDKAQKYDIWSTRAQEDVLAETMISCDVSLKDRSRSVETYDYSLAQKYYEELENSQGHKRKRDEKNFSFRSGKRPNSRERPFKGTPKDLPDLIVNESSNVEDIVKDIATKLGEERDDLILKVTETMGQKKTIEFYKETQKVERDGGLPVLNGTRRRTTGGVFLYLVRNDYYITPEQKQAIFGEDKQKYNRTVKEKRKKKLKELKMHMHQERNKILPDLLTRAEAFAKENLKREIKESDEANCTNPPPSPESDHQENSDGMDPLPIMATETLPSHTLNCEENKSRGELKTYDDDYLDISCDNEMDLF